MPRPLLFGKLPLLGQKLLGLLLVRLLSCCGLARAVIQVGLSSQAASQSQRVPDL
jgi:hypothetical protein